MEKILSKYIEKWSSPSDINEHLPTLKQYAEESEIIMEMGVRSIVSTWAFLAAKPKKLYSLDLYHPSQYGGNLDEVIEFSKENGIDFEFIEGDSLQIDIPNVDLLFIDTWHDYLQLKKELYLHHAKVKNYMIFHDTNTFGYVNEPMYEEYGNPQKETNLPKGLCPAIDEFLIQNPNWKIWERKPNNNGLTILKKITL